jgi:hypothetical protein
MVTIKDSKRVVSILGFQVTPNMEQIVEDNMVDVFRVATKGTISLRESSSLMDLIIRR